MALSWQTLGPELCRSLSPDLWVLFVAEDERPLQGLGGLLDWQISAGLSRWMKRGELTGRAGEQALLMPENPGPRVLAVGLGPSDSVARTDWSALVNMVSQAIARLQPSSVVVGLPEQLDDDRSAALLESALVAFRGDLTLVRSSAAGKQAAPTAPGAEMAAPPASGEPSLPSVEPVPSPTASEGPSASTAAPSGGKGGGRGRRRRNLAGPGGAS